MVDGLQRPGAECACLRRIPPEPDAAPGWLPGAAGARQQAIAVGNFFPQTQQATGDYQRYAVSTAVPNRSNVRSPFYSQWTYGFTLAWELDFWGRFRRAVESANHSLDASVEDYDYVLVTLLGDVGTYYAQVRTFKQRIAYARANVELQRQTLKIAEARYKAGTTGELDVLQARSTLEQTEGQIAELEISLRQANNQLCVLLGIPPEELRSRLGPGHILTAPAEVAAGIPADLLRCRPDVRRAERQAAAQSAQIGVTEADFYPHISITGSVNYSAGIPLLPRPAEIVPLLSCVLARRSILSIGGFSLAGGPDNQEIVRQHTESHLDPHTLQTPTTEPTQTPVGLGIREPQFHRLAPLAVDRLGLGRLHLRLVRHDQILMFIPLDCSSLCAAGAPPCQRALLTMLLGTAIGPHLHRAPFGSLARLLADPRQPMSLRAHIDLLLGLPDDFALGDLPLRSLGTPLLRPVVLLIGGIQLHIRLRNRTDPRPRHTPHRPRSP